MLRILKVSIWICQSFIWKIHHNIKCLYLQLFCVCVCSQVKSGQSDSLSKSISTAVTKTKWRSVCVSFACCGMIHFKHKMFPNVLFRHHWSAHWFVWLVYFVESGTVMLQRAEGKKVEEFIFIFYLKNKKSFWGLTVN